MDNDNADTPTPSSPEGWPTPEGDFRSGFVALAGEPNVGKSTLMNAVLGMKISITTSRPQTTRNRIVGIHTVKGKGQLIFVDTPGIHKPHKELNVVMVDTALKSIGETDLVLFVVDVMHAVDKEGRVNRPNAFIAQRLSEMGLPVVIALNKIDRLKNRAAVLPLVEAFATIEGLEPLAVVPISAQEGDGLDGLVETLFGHLPPGPQLYPEDMATDQAERFIAGEIVREKLTLQTRKEIPYSSAVIVEEFREDRSRGLLKIRAVIHVERDSQKAIVIGKKGARLKQIGSQARGDLERFFGKQIYLDLHVTVNKGWSEDARRLKSLGYVRHDSGE